MKKITVLIVVIAAIIALVGSIFIGNFLKTKSEEIQIVVASRDIYPGQTITSADISYLNVPKTLVNYIMPNVIIDPKAVVGKMSKTFISQDQYLNPNFFAEEKNPSFIIHKVATPGKYIITISGTAFQLDLNALYPQCKVYIFVPGQKGNEGAYARVIDYKGAVLKGWSYSTNSGEYKGDYVILEIDKSELDKIKQFIPNVYISVVKE